MLDDRELRLTALRRRRRRRLLDVLPAIYARQPAGSAVYELIDVMAGQLAELDDAMDQVLVGRWVRLAAGAPLFAGLDPPLDLLGAIFDLSRLPAEYGLSGEESESYRSRLLTVASVLTHGVTTPRTLLALTMAVFGARLLPELVRKGNTIEGIGVPVAEGAAADGAPGSQPDPIRARVIDNRLVVRELSMRNLTHRSHFTVRSRGLLSDRPIITFAAAQGDLDHPALRNIATKEVVVFAGRIPKGSSLVIRPQLKPTERAPFSQLDGPDPHYWEGAHATMGTDDVSSQIYYQPAAAQFDFSRFADDNAEEPQDPALAENPKTAVARFADPRQRVCTPQVRPGQDEWEFVGYTKDDLRGVTDPAGADLSASAPTEAGVAGASLTLTYATRDLAAFRLEVQHSQAVARDPRSALLLRQLVERVRGAGIRAEVVFVAELGAEDHAAFLRDEGPAIAVTHQEPGGTAPDPGPAQTQKGG